MRHTASVPAVRPLACVTTMVAIALAGCGNEAVRWSNARSSAAQAATTPAAPVAIRPPAASSEGCAATVRYAGAESGTGNVFARFVIEATPGRRCALQGRPEVTLIDAQGRSRSTHRSRDHLISDPRARGPVVDVHRGHPAQFEVGYRFATPAGRGCRRAAGISVRLGPGEPRHRAVVRADAPGSRMFAPCGGEIAVTPIHAAG